MEPLEAGTIDSPRSRLENIQHSGSPALARRTGQPRWALAAAILVFLAHALNYLTFFVDDEGIPFVFGSRLVRGLGLTYNSIEGRVEGYSDFLHVVIDGLIFAVTRAVGASRLDVFFVGKALSLAAGLGTVCLVFAALRRFRAVTNVGTSAALAFVALSGPLAVWSCSSLETAPFAWLVTLLIVALIAGDDNDESRSWNRVAGVAAVLVCLERLDGVVFAGSALAAWVLLSPRPRRAEILLHICLPVASIAAMYHIGRMVYFGHPLNMPAYAKVLYKVSDDPRLVTRAPREDYTRQFVDTFGWPVVAAFAVIAAHAAVRSDQVRRCLLAAALMITYVSVVGDWMFGFRFFVPIIPLIAILVGQVISIEFIGGWRPIGWAVTAAFAVWLGVGDVAFEREYMATSWRTNWWQHPTLKAPDFFRPYYEVYEMAARYVHPGDRMAYNQAGFVPFMLDADNIDDLGICSEFYGRMPTRDVIFTEVGRYAPLLDRPVIEATSAYLLYQDVRFIIVPGGLLRTSHDGHTPEELLGGHYRLIDAVPAGGMYVHDADNGDYRSNIRLFTENLAHAASVDAVVENGRSIPVDERTARFGFLKQEYGSLMFTGAEQLDVVFGDRDEDVSHLYVDRLVADQPVVLTLQLRSVSGSVQFETKTELQPGIPQRIDQQLPYTAASASLTLLMRGPANPTQVFLQDLRVLGQSKQLLAFVRHRLEGAPAGESAYQRVFKSKVWRRVLRRTAVPERSVTPALQARRRRQV